MSTCATCRKELNDAVLGAGDCGGDCEECIIRAGDPDVGLRYLALAQRMQKMLEGSDTLRIAALEERLARLERVVETRIY